MPQTDTPSRFNLPAFARNPLLQVFVAHKKAILIPTVAAFFIAIIVGFSLPNIYSAEALILPAQEEKGLMNTLLLQMGNIPLLPSGAFGGGTTSDLYVTILKSKAVKDLVIDRFGLMKIYRDKYRLDTYASIEKRASITAGKKDGVITIVIEDKDPTRAADIANAFVEELQKLTVTLNAGSAGRNGTFLAERLSRAKADLASAEGHLRTFQAKNKAVAVTDQVKATIEGVAQLKAQLALQEGQLSALRQKFTDTSQPIKSATASIANLRSQIARLEGSGGGSAVPTIGSVPALGEEYARLMREFKIQESMVELLTKQLEMARLSEAKDVSPIQVLQKATAPDRKSKPHRAFLVIMMTLTTFLAATVVALVVDRFAKIPVNEHVTGT